MSRASSTANPLIKSSVVATHAVEVINAEKGECTKHDIIPFMVERFGFDPVNFKHTMHSASQMGWVTFDRCEGGRWQTTEKGDRMLIDFEKVAGVIIGVRETAVPAPQQKDGAR
ncbi:hypothetical protein ACR0ST_04205 [Aliidiomarina sp. Khilg15.8]